MDPYLENEDEDEGLPEVAVGGLGAVPTAFSAADLASQMNAANAMVDKQIAAYRQMLESGANRLRERRVGPTAAERLFAISEAFSRPTRTGQFGERMGMLAQTLGAQSRAKREEELARDEMLEKIGLKGIELELGAGQKRQALLAQLIAKQQAADAAKAKAEAAANRPGEKERMIAKALSLPEGDPERKLLLSAIPGTPENIAAMVEKAAGIQGTKPPPKAGKPRYMRGPDGKLYKWSD